MENILHDILNVSVFSILGILLMMLGNFLIDLIVPCHFPTEIKKGNQAVGWLTAGSFIGIGYIVKTAIQSPAVADLQQSLTQGITESLIYFVIGVALFCVCYVLVNVFNRKYNLNDEIGNGNTAAGIMVFGIFIGIALVISGAIN